MADPNGLPASTALSSRHNRPEYRAWFEGLKPALEVLNTLHQAGRKSKHEHTPSLMGLLYPQFRVLLQNSAVRQPAELDMEEYLERRSRRHRRPRVEDEAVDDTELAFAMLRLMEIELDIDAEGQQDLAPIVTHCASALRLLQHELHVTKVFRPRKRPPQSAEIESYVRTYRHTERGKEYLGVFAMHLRWQDVRRELDKAKRKEAEQKQEDYKKWLATQLAAKAVVATDTDSDNDEDEGIDQEMIDSWLARADEWRPVITSLDQLPIWHIASKTGDGVMRIVPKHLVVRFFHWLNDQD